MLFTLHIITLDSILVIFLLSGDISKVVLLILPILARTRKERRKKKGRPWRMNSNGCPLSQKPDAPNKTGE